MHELSIALRIVEALDEELAEEADHLDSGELAVSAVTIQVGALTGLVPEALQFAWDMSTDNSRLQGSKLNIEWIDAAGYCPECQSERTITNLQSFRCPVCRTPIAQIVGGNEMEILTMEVQAKETPEPL
jgi:hydrogenase nickel incorporation protein HypA/HybF